ncbi:DUF433 domain-containing protein [Spirosoma endophyticum]|uniref:Uncharacterized conserved protein, DUF433 family n=1 Tax=Spirosoma endophyticum TaxID=662367 RepID=A0A1I2HEI4_9BACT|nr:DUF433 domain-containing protein [Spirosoma endophyticum]SFF27958.1 Uncharacterized conserved protein, DUF433 family [Spirosoma endophyticum]
MNYRERVVSDHQTMLGKPVIKGTRITVELVLRKLSEGATTQDLLIMYPHLQEIDVLAALMYASDVLANEEIIMAKAA